MKIFRLQAGLLLGNQCAVRAHQGTTASASIVSPQPHLSLMRSRLNLISLSARFPLKEADRSLGGTVYKELIRQDPAAMLLLPCDMLVSLYLPTICSVCLPTSPLEAVFLPSNHLQTTFNDTLRRVHDLRWLSLHPDLQYILYTCT